MTGEHYQICPNCHNVMLPGAYHICRSSNRGVEDKMARESAEIAELLKRLVFLLETLLRRM